MNLYINTSGKLCEIALFQSSSVVQHIIHEEPMQHSGVLHDLIDKILKDNNVTFSKLDCIGVLNGPGSYTGLRVGLAAAKSLCYALEIPLILFNKLELSCSYYQSAHSADNPIGSIESARAGEFFFCLIRGEEKIYEPSVYPSDTIKTILEEEYSNHVLISLSNEEIDLELKQPVQTTIPLKYIADKLHNSLINKEFANIYTSEPFYLKKVHINTPKKKF